MSASSLRSELARKSKQRLDAERKVGDYRTKESQSRGAAAKARRAAEATRSASTARSRLREAERHERAAETAGKEASRWQARMTNFAKQEATSRTRLMRAEQAEAAAVERDRVQERRSADKAGAAQRAALEARVTGAENEVRAAIRRLPEPEPEKLRVLLLGSSSLGDLRVGREQKRIRAAVQSALHRDQIELDVRPAASTADLLDGISRFRPHVVHFSGHSDDALIVFESEIDAHHEGVVVTGKAFAAAIAATDTPPHLVLLNSCNSASQIENLVSGPVPFAIGMAAEIDDGDAINYAAQFYAAIANGQSIWSAHMSGRAALELAGLSGVDLPTLASAPNVDPVNTVLVTGTLSL